MLWPSFIYERLNKIICGRYKLLKLGLGLSDSHSSLLIAGSCFSEIINGCVQNCNFVPTWICFKGTYHYSVNQCLYHLSQHMNIKDPGVVVQPSPTYLTSLGFKNTYITPMMNILFSYSLFLKEQILHLHD